MSTHSGIKFLPVGRLEELYRQIEDLEYAIVAPEVVDGAVQYRQTSSPSTLPLGVQDQHAPGHYRLSSSNRGRHFSWSCGVQGIKSMLFPPQQPLWCSEQQADGALQFHSITHSAQPIALFGVRACDLAAIELMDRHFLREGAEDPWYRAQRKAMLLVAVSCSHGSENCFCVSTSTGPEPRSGYDLRLDELESGFLLKAGSERGAQIVSALQLAVADESQVEQAHLQLAGVVTQQQRAIATDDFRPHFSQQLDSPIWEEIAARCLGCGNCTAVCPTCFCHREEDAADLSLQHSTHQRVWDSCFSDEHSQLHGIPVRSGRRERYRQWMTHKLAGWHDQFDESGCVGCGRCITWCPVGIDLVKESARFVEEVQDEP